LRAERCGASANLPNPHANRGNVATGTRESLQQGVKRASGGGAEQLEAVTGDATKRHLHERQSGSSKLQGCAAQSARQHSQGAVQGVFMQITRHLGLQPSHRLASAQRALVAAVLSSTTLAAVHVFAESSRFGRRREDAEGRYLVHGANKTLGRPDSTSRTNMTSGGAFMPAN
jgi:hypothetical protein